MKMMKKSIALLMAGCVAQSIVADLPANWAANANYLVSASEGMKASLNEDAILYTSQQALVQSAIDKIDSNKIFRDSVFACMESKFNSLVSQLDACQELTTATIEAGNQYIQGVDQQILALKQETDAQIADLISTKTTKTALYNAWVKHFNEDLGVYASEADVILSKLNSLGDAFDSAIANRVNLSSKIDQLLSKIDSDMQQEQGNLYALQASICDAPAPAATPTYSDYQYDAISCPSAAYLASEGYNSPAGTGVNY
jgi:hypothetical protein